MNKLEFKIAILITTIDRDDLLERVVNSIREIQPLNWKIFIADQKPSAKKENKYSDCFYYSVPYDSGISYGRNFLVEKANELDYKYCLISADSIEFTNSMKNLNALVDIMNVEGTDLIGLGLKNRISWEGHLKLIKNDCFEIDFIEKKQTGNNINFWDCNICRNFFVARTKTLSHVKWDQELTMREHEDFFLRWSTAGYKVKCTDYCKGEYIGEKTGKYGQIRETNWLNSWNVLKKKYNLKKWITYKNLENAQKYKD